MKKLNPALLFLAIVLLPTLLLAQGEENAQFTRAHIATAKTIVIIINDLDPQLNDANAHLEEAMKNYWTATKVNFKTRKYSEVKSDNSTDLYIGILPKINGILDSKGKGGQYFITFEKNKGNGKLTLAGVPDIELYPKPQKLDIISSVRILNAYVGEVIKGTIDNKTRVTSGGLPPAYYKLATNNRGILKNKTLLIDQESLAKKTTEEDLKAEYPGKIKLVSKNEILGFVESKNPAYAYTFSAVAYDGTRTSGCLVIDAETGKVLSYAKNPSIAITVQSSPDPIKISKKVIESLDENSK